MAKDNGEERVASKRVGALRGLAAVSGTLPQESAPWRWLHLVLTAAISLVLPLAVRRVVDGFNAGNTGLLDQYFGAALGIAALLAFGTGLRYYLVTRLGERVVADIRRALFDRVMAMSPAFFERILTGEVLSRLTTDTTLILSVIGSSVSVALRNMLILLGGLVLLDADLGQIDGSGAADRACRGGADHRAWAPAAKAVARKSGLDCQFVRVRVRSAVIGANSAGLYP